MRRIVILILAPTGLLLFGLGANGQQSERWEQSDFFDHVRADLDKAAANTSSRTGERIHAAQRDISAFQRQRTDANYDPADLDKAIAALQQIVNSNSMPKHDQDVLTGDLRELRHFRAYYVNSE
jgi:hypothetical protein